MNKSTYAAITEGLHGTFSKFTWSRAKQTYATAKGALPPDAPRVVVDNQIAATSKRMGKLGDELKMADRGAGWNDAVDKWATAFREEQRAVELHSASVGHGGLHSMPIEAYDRTEATIKTAFDYHDDVVAKLKADPDYVDSKTFDNHADKYPRRARLSYENERALSHADAGFAFGMRITHSMKPCPTCESLDGVEAPADEVQPLGEDCECEGYCDCTIEFYNESRE